MEFKTLPEAVLQSFLTKSCPENMLQIHRRTPIPMCDCKTTLFKSHFDMGVFLEIYCIFSKRLFLRTPLEGYFCIFHRTQDVHLEYLRRSGDVQDVSLYKFYFYCSLNKLFKNTGTYCI